MFFRLAPRLHRWAKRNCRPGAGAANLVFLCAAALLLAGCSRRQPPAAFQRLTILRFENLGADSSTDWMGRALSEMVTTELAGAPRIYAVPSSRLHAYERVLGARPVSAPGIAAERDLAITADANRLGYGYYAVRGGKLETRLTLADPQSGKMSAVFSASAPAGDIVAAASALARQIWPEAAPYPPVDAQSLKAYVAALESSDPPAVAGDLERALAASPDFAPAYRLLAQVKAQAKDPAGALDAIRRALARPIQPAARARLELESAELRGDRAARLRALNALAKLTPADPAVWRGIADAAFSARRYSASVSASRMALEIEPRDAATLNQLGYAYAYSGDFKAAEETLLRYKSLQPADANPFDSLGDVNLLSGRLPEAEKLYLEAAAKTPHFQMDGPLYKAAIARLMTGDIAGADALARRYLEARAAERDPALGYRAAEWSWATGRRMEARSRLAAFARSAANGPLRDLAARAYAESAIWNLTLGDREAAARDAGNAGAIAGPASAAIASVVRFLAQPPASSAEWQARAAREFPQPGQQSVRDFALAYALLFAKDFQSASAVLKQIHDSGEQVDGEALPVLLAWTYLETGRTKEAASLIQLNPIPASSGTGPFFSFYFPRLYYLRARLAEQEGNPSQAAANYQPFKKLSGPTPLIWGEEAKAK